MQVVKSTVKVEMNKRATAASVKEFAPDAVVIATGSTPLTPDIPGIKGENVVNHRKVLSGEKGVGDKVIVIGGGYVGCETAEFLAEKGKDLTVAFPEPEPILDVVCWAIRKLMLRKLEEKKIKILAGVKQFREITPKGIGVISKEGKEVFLEADNIILATGAVPEKSLIHSLSGKVREIYEAGDCVEVRRILEAVHEGAKAALEI
jgi:pyruvate/2-oxoglutarate dehydrogenase complex dihydrolipoamide dehydrogenase (E3) component